MFHRRLIFAIGLTIILDSLTETFFVNGRVLSDVLLSDIEAAASDTVEEKANPNDDATSDPADEETFTAAVYEHAVRLPVLGKAPLPRDEAVSEMMHNLRVYQAKTKEAADMGADIIVFPEDGVYGFAFNSRDLIYPFLEYIPEASAQWSPCSDPTRYPNADVQVHLSCMAKENKMYVVANIGDKQPCNKSDDPNCPDDGRYQFNTDVVYDPSGTLIAKYHKYNLYYEYQFDTPVHFDSVIFETPFGKFGVFTCFDILFEHPAVDIVQRHNVTNVLFQTAWMDAAPYLTSVQFHSSFAIAHGVNVLSSNLHLPLGRFHGSGIYTPNGASAVYYNTSTSSGGQLLVRNISKVASPIDLQYVPTPDPVDEPTEQHFVARLFKDMHNLVPLLNTSGQASVCHNTHCCHVSYNDHDSVTNNSDSTNSSATDLPDYTGVLPSSTEFYALAAFNGMHKKTSRYFLQICSLVRCRTDSDANVTCGYHVDDNKDVDNTTSRRYPINTFTLYGNFTTAYVYPQILLKDGDDLMLTSYPRQWSYSGGLLESINELSAPLDVASMIGRDYTRDIPL